MIIADIVQTITVDSTLENAITLGSSCSCGRSSASLEIELEGVIRWRRGSPKPDRSA